MKTDFIDIVHMTYCIFTHEMSPPFRSFPCQMPTNQYLFSTEYRIRIRKRNPSKLPPGVESGILNQRQSRFPTITLVYSTGSSFQISTATHIWAQICDML